MQPSTDVAVVGGGILGLATALELSTRFEGLAITVLEKESDLATHQSGRNSGVIHSGLYYRPGSLKARLCVDGAERLVQFCEEHGVPFARNGKVVVATSPSEVPALDELERRGRANGLPGLRRLGPSELEEVEPHAVGVEALHVPSTGTVDFRSVAEAMAAVLRRRGAEIMTSFHVESIHLDADAVSLQGVAAEVSARSVVNCAGLHADRVAEMMGVDPPARIIPFRGEYYDVAKRSGELVNSSIYPVPYPDLPFLGVHLTRGIQGVVHAGPNAVLALAKEGYSWRSVRPGELWKAVAYGGFRKLAGQHWRAGLSEMVRSASKRLFVQAARKLVPDLDTRDFRKARSGVRAQAVSPDGDLIDDFLLEESGRAVHVLNAPSPAATASLAIADYLADRIAGSLGLGR